MAQSLGRGLSSLIPDANRPLKKTNEPQQSLSPDAITANPFQPRTAFDEKALADLTRSIKEHGILQPLVVSPAATPGQYELIAGERRLTAARTLGLASVPVMIRDASAQDKLELALIENIQRADLNPLERARAYARLLDEFSLTQEEVSQRVGMSRESVANALRLLHLPKLMQEALAAGRITEGHAKVLLSIHDAEKQQKVFKEMLKGMTVAEGARAAKGKSGTAKAKKGATHPALKAYEDQLRTALGTKVRIDGDQKTGEIHVSYFSEEELRHLIDQLS